MNTLRFAIWLLWRVLKNAALLVVLLPLSPFIIILGALFEWVLDEHAIYLNKRRTRIEENRDV